ncbi:hypothetical protein ECHHL_0629 [Ehrlichia chaffeensis str. Heartland]|uniref:DUF721 domain-containing protein n=1 Tax=Ehrlichia chaffeensis (strain ATCC CRL-10679 / Arkansas) TaxID=205920 RepID=Q2GGC0_EHRCR|nr:DUF721 domain-containing protein [Ehrlichia chaffeensis]ABD45016.1 conserved hypothetical protein [Ehrlichia chaffeensis str. Arkansas]ABD45177.1 conserved hypothetical protein [Ehrlichia chaffeensis str. Arkansas]ABD45443.1 conserved hypothetical protein [Ehrlichia chaffeensis str. Arkansas]AHX03775.1 hypothetical protein ECHHL_0623 [Ehrlichia chaffeensis str. Heartland]AHX03778.1 hypothetical protein ECHHL_0626 [Ehrlichia chaffeensis str. Heartland]
MLFRSGPKTIGSAVEKLILNKCDKNHISKIEVLLFFNWNNIVGEEISQVAKPKKLSFLNAMNTGVLYLVVNNGGVAINIQYAIPIIIEKISVFFGFKVVNIIKIRQQL